MSKPDTLENRLQSWNPRRPSEDVARNIFDAARREQRAAASPRSGVSLLRGMEIWNWLTPVAACCLTMVVLCGAGNSKPAMRLRSRDNATFFAMASSNLALKTFELSKADENIEWNVWPHATLPTTNFSSAQHELRPVSNSIHGIYP
jgi:hypothetical protein